jgi:hypothetical protein
MAVHRKRSKNVKLLSVSAHQSDCGRKEQEPKSFSYDTEIILSHATKSHSQQIVPEDRIFTAADPCLQQKAFVGSARARSYKQSWATSSAWI